MAGRLARSLERLGTETAFETLARAKALEAEGRRIIHLEIGEPDFPTAPHIVEAAAKALRDGHTHYCQAPGLPALRDACAEHLSRHRGPEIDPPRLLYEGEQATTAGPEGLLDGTILVDGLSKTFAMTGWRLGYAALPSELVEPVTRLLINSVSCTAPAVQLAGVAALQGPRTEVE